ncbi:MAG: PaaI family thioesterase [Trueperaceae bacterium]|nr:PaaI family thioesterase [Trueperaceae bacterium]
MIAKRLKQVESGPYWQLLGMKIVEAQEGKVKLELELKEEHMQIYGVVHGGVLASLVDSAVGVAVQSTLSDLEGSTTTNLQIMYARPAKAGRLIAEAELIRRGKTIVFGDCRVSDASGELIVHGNATYMILDLQRWSKDKAVRLELDKS